MKAQASSYKLEDVMASLQKMWGGESLAEKHQEKKRRAGAAKTAPESNAMDNAVWASQEPEDHEDLNPEEVFDESLEAYMMEDPENEEVYVAYQEAKHRFYKDARRSLDKARASRGFYPTKGLGKGSGKPGAGGRSGGFQGRCMRCGKFGHKGMDCRQQSKNNDGGGSSSVGFVFTVFDQTEPAGAEGSSTGDAMPDSPEAEAVLAMVADLGTRIITAPSPCCVTRVLAFTLCVF